MSGLGKRLGSGLFWVIVAIIIFEEGTYIIPFLSLALLVGLCWTPFMRGIGNFLLSYCDSVSEGEYKLTVSFKGEKKRRVLFCHRFFNDSKRKELRVRRAREVGERGPVRIDAGYTYLQIEFVPKEAPKKKSR